MRMKKANNKEKKTWNEVKDVLKKKIRKFWIKTKKLCIKIWDYIKKVVKQLKDKFMELPKKIRMIVYVWGAVLVVLLLFILATSSSKKFYNKYSTFEDNLSAATLRYVMDKKIYATIDKKITVDLAVLKEEKYLSTIAIDDNTCDGFSVVYYDDDKSEYVIDSYLNCKRYTSKYYWDYK